MCKFGINPSRPDGHPRRSAEIAPESGIHCSGVTSRSRFSALSRSLPLALALALALALVLVLVVLVMVMVVWLVLVVVVVLVLVMLLGGLVVVLWDVLFMFF